MFRDPGIYNVIWITLMYVEDCEPLWDYLKARYFIPILLASFYKGTVINLTQVVLSSISSIQNCLYWFCILRNQVEYIRKLFWDICYLIKFFPIFNFTHEDVMDLIFSSLVRLRRKRKIITTYPHRTILYLHTILKTALRLVSSRINELCHYPLVIQWDYNPPGYAVSKTEYSNFLCPGPLFLLVAFSVKSITVYQVLS